MNIALTPELETFIQTNVQSGRYSSESEVVKEALRLLQINEQQRAVQLAEFRSNVDARIASLDRGEGVDGETVFAELRARSEERRTKLV